MSAEMNIFDPVQDSVFTAKLFLELKKNKVELTVKSKDMGSVQGKVVNCTDKELVMVPLKTSDFLRFADGLVSVWFNHGGRRFLFQSNLRRSEKHVHLEADQGLIFQQQKRQEFRFEIPNSYVAIFQVLNLNGQNVDLEGRVLNISPHGALLECETQVKLKNEDLIVCQISFGKHPPISAKARLRHIGNSSGVLQLGVEFQYKTISEEDDVQELVMHLRKDVFEMGKAHLA